MVATITALDIGTVTMGHFPVLSPFQPGTWRLRLKHWVPHLPPPSKAGLTGVWPEAGTAQSDLIQPRRPQKESLSGLWAEV